MSMEQVRADIAAAAGTVEGVIAVASKPETPVEGMAWVVWVESEPLTSGLFDTQWRLVVMLPQNLEAALDLMHSFIDEITTAVQIAVVGAAVGKVRPGRLAGDNSPPVLTFDVRAATTYGG